MDSMIVNLIVAMMVVAVALTLLQRLVPRSLRGTGSWHYRYDSATRLLTDAEARFFAALEEAAPPGVRLFAKVRIADVVRVGRGTSGAERLRAFNRISAKHVDFVLCRSADLSFVGAVELDDASHDRADRRDRDDLVERVFASAGLPLARVRVARHYAPERLEEVFASLGLNELAVKRTAPTDGQAAAPDRSDRCPSCGGELHERQEQRGANAIRRYLVCSRHPRCTYRRPVRGGTDTDNSGSASSITADPRASAQ